MIRKSALAASIAALLTPAVADALGLGNIQVTSALNEPLQARIPLRGADPGQIEELRVALADDQQFQRAGLDRVYVLTKLRFEVVEASSGSGFISISTREPVSEPFLNFLVDVNWPRGRVLREYTVLLDPPVYGAAISSGTGRQVKTVDSLPAPSAPASPPRRSAAPAPSSAPLVSSGSPSAAPRYTGDSYGPVRRGETLWSIAEQTRPTGTSIQNMMLALLRANPEAFSLDNVNALRTGAVLRIPAASEVSGSKAAALEEVARQHALWAEYRQSISATVSAQPGGTAPVTAATATAQPGAAAPATAGGAAAGQGADSAELKLVGAGTTGAATGGGAEEIAALRNELTMAQEEAQAAAQENQELQSRLTEVESLVGDLQRLVELKEDQLAALQDQLAKAGEQAPMPAPDTAAQTPPAQAAAVEKTETKVAEAPPAAATEPAPPVKKRRPPPPPPPPKSFMDEINDMLPVPLWSILAGVGVLLLGFGGLRFARGRKEKAAAAAAAPMAGAAGTMGEATGQSMIEQYAQTEMPEVDADEAATELPGVPSADEATLLDDADEDRTEMAATAKTTATPPSDEEDPLAEVNVYLAYERFDQAEQLVRDAISGYPDRHDYKLKLLEVFYAAKNLAAFEAAAGGLRDAVGDDHAMMQQAREWWSDLGADRALFAEDDGPSTHQGAEPGADGDMFDVTAAESGEETGVDFDLGFTDADGSASADAGNLDFDLGADASSEGSSLDFDLGSLGDTVAGGAAVAGAAVAAGTDLDFDLSADAEAADAGAETGVDFDLGSLGDDAGTASADAGADEISPDAVTAPAPARTVPSDADTGIDFDLGSLEDGAEAVDAAGGAASADDVSLDFDLGDTGGTVAPDAAATLQDAAGEESGLDFDLGDTTTLDDGGTDGKGTASALDFDLGDTGAGAGPAAGDDDATAMGAGSVLDFDLGDTQETPGASTSADAGDAAASELDFDLGDTQETPDASTSADAGDGAGSELDFDLGDTLEVPDDAGKAATDAAAGSELDFDLGDTAGSTATDAAAGSDLDFDLGDTHDAGAQSSGTAADTGTGADLDFDLSDTVENLGAASEPPAAAAAAGEGSELDFDLTDTMGMTVGASSSTDAEPDEALDFDLGDTASEVAAASGADLDLNLDAGDGDAQPSLDAGEDGSELDFTLDAGDGSDALPELDTGGDEPPAFDTVQLDPDAAASIRESGEDGGESSEFGVDTEFRGIFSDVEAGDGAGSGSGSVLDFDLGSADLGAGADDGESTALSDVESTQFMLQDIQMDDSGEDEDDNTLVLGRGASGEVDEIQTKLDLAQAYMDMGDTEGARNLLGEVMAEGNDPQKEQAGEMLKKLA